MSELERTHARYVAATGQLITLAEYTAMRAIWIGFGGDFHGPIVETGTMPEVKLLPLLAELRDAASDAIRLHKDKCDALDRIRELEAALADLMTDVGKFYWDRDFDIQMSLAKARKSVPPKGDDHG
jgi:hypothetical protein